MHEKLHPNAYAIRPTRLISADELRYYDATFFPNDPWGGIEITLRRMWICESDGHDDSLLLDVLNRDGDIIQDYPMSKRGFEYLREKLKFKVDPTGGC